MINILKLITIKPIFLKPFTPDLNISKLIANNNQTNNTSVNESLSTSNNRPKKFFKNSPLIHISILAVVIVLIAVFSIKNLTKPQSVLTSTLGTQDQRINIEKPKAVQSINKQYLFPLKDTSDQEVSKLKYEIQNAELRDEIVIKGQKATEVNGKTFLVLNLKITNDYNKAVDINTRDYIRLMVNNSSEKLAPEIHNDPVEIQAISTKYTRLGFQISDTDKNLTLQIGEITGKKELLKLKF